MLDPDKALPNCMAGITLHDGVGSAQCKDREDCQLPTED